MTSRPQLAEFISNGEFKDHYYVQFKDHFTWGDAKNMRVSVEYIFFQTHTNAKRIIYFSWPFPFPDKHIIKDALDLTGIHNHLIKLLTTENEKCQYDMELSKNTIKYYSHTKCFGAKKMLKKLLPKKP